MEVEPLVATEPLNSVLLSVLVLVVAESVPVELVSVVLWQPVITAAVIAKAKNAVRTLLIFMFTSSFQSLDWFCLFFKVWQQYIVAM